MIKQAKHFYAVHFGGMDVFNEAGWAHIVEVRIILFLLSAILIPMYRENQSRASALSGQSRPGQILGLYLHTPNQKCCSELPPVAVLELRDGGGAHRKNLLKKKLNFLRKKLIKKRL
jgi:hypothetical protein